MHFYRTLNAIEAMTFDLDDTLYDNVPVMAKAETAMITHLQHLPALSQLTFAEFTQIKRQLLITDPEIYHDVITWRQKTLRTLLALYGFSPNATEAITEGAMACFIHWRHAFTVPESAQQILTRLAAKLPLAVISNGNVEIAKIGLDCHFQFALRGGVDGRSKPYPDIFQQAARQLHIAPERILHIGDNLIADVAGAVQNGFQACWINLSGKTLWQHPEARCLPHVEISDLAALENLL